MTREQAKREIDSLDFYLQNHTDDYGEESHTAMMMAIKALEQEPCEDAISRQAAIDAIDKWVKAEHVLETLPTDKVTPLFKSVHKLPPVNPQTKVGHWIRWYEKVEYKDWTDYMPYCKCSECGKQYDPHSSQFIQYCSKCGAKMVEPQESEDKE